jgi:hypothetical protein
VFDRRGSTALYAWTSQVFTLPTKFAAGRHFASGTLNRSVPTTWGEQSEQPYNFVFIPAERAPTVRASIWAALSGVLALGT